MKSIKLDGKIISADDLQERCSKLTDCSRELGLVNNYLSCLALQYAQNTNDRENHVYILYSLFNEKGLDNMIEVIDSLCESIIETSNYLCDVEGIIND
ncbi:hypothetical protein [Vagococcus acidifermentans]|uniref:Uncharacterized protein n=1 Tax=Vagococcus acidifermentans TaxID=564710 RepID=A0A430AMN4_9ENTE|nr:hypothetical protein [Vagococcus acidifermentans]RSU09381.1 hypothetical protein CBF27_12670 [Vagococcus acidifermentans]